VNRAEETRLAQTLRMCDDTIAHIQERPDSDLDVLLQEVRGLRQETLDELVALRASARAGEG
jgi:hypothetical protein